ncbi:DUF4236 domain-containing protein [uncultured Bifidobacterium sp.]|uniref:DUF4236 domain-containing protein n=1 Tax=uncultured Bifidobacterium sp. TaxID=165187 RepID=UPI002594F118|nr:DUF4236 domain-containing protein [uncultured Bifidobacterium sp.]
MGFRIRKSIRLGKGLRLNLGKSGVTSVTMGKRGAPHVTVGKGGTRFGTPVIPGTGISYETRLDKPSKKTRRKNTTMNRQQGPAPMPAGRATPMPQQAAMPTQQMPIIPPAGAMPPYAPATPPYGGGNGGNPHKAKKPWYKRWWGLTIIVLLAIGVIGYIFTPSKPIPNTVGQTVSEARTTLEKAGFKTITVTPETKGQDKKWKVEKQTPEAGQKEKTSTAITLTVKRDNSDLADIVKKGMMLDKAINALTDEGYSTSDYKIESDSGKSVILYSNWEILSADNGVIRVHNKAADEEAARKAEEEAAQKAEEEKKAAEEQARQQAEQQAQQQAAAEEAARQAQQQAEQQQAQQQQQASTYYPNCTAAKAAGAAPLYRGQPGYSTKLDRDGDGVACEK